MNKPIEQCLTADEIEGVHLMCHLTKGHDGQHEGKPQGLGYFSENEKTHAKSKTNLRQTAMRRFRFMLDLMKDLPDWECKPIGNLHPPGLHCISCTAYRLKVQLWEAVKFWDEDDHWKKALS